MSKGEAMKPQPFIHMRSNACSPTIVEGLVSLFPGTDWYRFGGVAIQADPCDDCGGCGERTAEMYPRIAGLGECPKCHGLGVIPRHGSIEWRCSWGDGATEGSCRAMGADDGHALCGWVLVVPIEGDE